jgi:primosomal protein N' (replication factor Y)
MHAGALLLLSSATPSVESMHSARSGKYQLYQITHRFNKKDMPPVIIADMRPELKDGNNGSIGAVLRHELERNIRSNEQSILFINRRGTNPLVTCGECGFTFKCRHCSVSMTYHSSNKRLLCHYCGSSLNVPAVCPDCGGKLKFIGAGTQKVESELLEIFPGIDIIRMDADTVTRINSHDKLLSRFRDGKAQILLGTQMVTKGLDFENVTLVGVLSADMSLYMSDYRAHEKTFSLITQVVGRSGRGDKPGRAVIQTFTPGNEVIILASKQDYDGFYEREIYLRQALGSPPVRDLMTLAVTGIDETAVLTACARLRGTLDNYFRGSGIKLLGPAPAPVTKVKNRYRYRLLISCENTKQVRTTIAHTIREFSRNNQSRGVSVFADAYLYD